MTHRERVIKMLQRRPVDRPAVQYYYTPVGFYEHGEKLNDLFEKYPGDFEAFSRRLITGPPSGSIDSEGRYYECITDEWGVTSEYRVFGIMGHAIDFPVKSIEDAADYTFPVQPEYINDPDIYKAAVAKNKKDYFVWGSGDGLLQRMWLIRGFENFMMDICDDTPEINLLMDRLTEYNRKKVEAAVAAGVDGISFGDDYGTQNGLLFSKELFRRIIKPRLKRMMEPARQAGLHIHFHSCGLVMDLFDEFKDLGVGSLWPQLPVYDMRELKRALDYYGFSIAIHTDRAGIMTSGSVEDVREAVMLENEIFKPKDGGAWFYIEPDTGFPYNNFKTLVETVFSL